MKTLLLLALSFVFLAACGGDEFSASRDGIGAAGEAAVGTGGSTSTAGSSGEPASGGTPSAGSAATAGIGGAEAGTGGSTETGAVGGTGAGTGGSDTGGATAGGAGGGGTGGMGGSGGSGGSPPVVFEEPRPLCGKTPKGATCERVVANGSDTTCEADGHCWCPTGSVLCRDTRFPLDQQLMCQRGTTCGQPKAPLEVSCTHDNQCGSGSLCDERAGIQVCFCSTSTSKVCRSATGNITCTAAGTPCAY